MSISYTRASEKDFDELVDFAINVFGGVDFPVELPKLYKKEYNTMPHHCIVKENDKIKAAIGGFPMELDVLGEKLQVRGIGTVSVHPECRGAGYMKELMKIHLEDMKKNGIHLSCLGGQRQRYEYFSYVPCGQKINFYIGETNIRHAFGNNIDTEISFNIVNENDTDTIEKMYELYNNEKVKITREKEQFLDILKSWRHNAYSIMKNNKFMGYIVLSEDKTSVNELILEDESLFIDIIASYIKINGIHGVSMSLPLYEKNKVRKVQQICESYSIDNNCQFTVLNYEKVIEALLRLKSTYSKLQDGVLKINIKEYGTVSIKVAGSEIIVKITDEESDISLNHLDAMQLLFAPLTPYVEVSEDSDMCIQSWLPLPLHIRRADHV